MVAERRPGTLLKLGITAMRQYLTERMCVAEGAAATTDSGLTPIVSQYFMHVVKAQRGKELGTRNERELQTLAKSLDCLLRGELAQAADCLMQRFKAVEMAATERGSWSLATKLELIPPGDASAVGGREKEAAATLELQEQKLKRLMEAGRRQNG